MPFNLLTVLAAYPEIVAITVNGTPIDDSLAMQHASNEQSLDIQVSPMKHDGLQALFVAL